MCKEIYQNIVETSYQFCSFPNLDSSTLPGSRYVEETLRCSRFSTSGSWYSSVTTSTIVQLCCDLRPNPLTDANLALFPFWCGNSLFIMKPLTAVSKLIFTIETRCCLPKLYSGEYSFWASAPTPEETRLHGELTLSSILNQSINSTGPINHWYRTIQSIIQNQSITNTRPINQ